MAIDNRFLCSFNGLLEATDTISTLKYYIYLIFASKKKEKKKFFLENFDKI